MTAGSETYHAEDSEVGKQTSLEVACSRQHRLHDWAHASYIHAFSQPNGTFLAEGIDGC